MKQRKQIMPVAAKQEVPIKIGTKQLTHLLGRRFIERQAGGVN